MPVLVACRARAARVAPVPFVHAPQAAADAPGNVEGVGKHDDAVAGGVGGERHRRTAAVDLRRKGLGGRSGM